MECHQLSVTSATLWKGETGGNWRECKSQDTKGGKKKRSKSLPSPRVESTGLVLRPARHQTKFIVTKAYQFIITFFQLAC